MDTHYPHHHSYLQPLPGEAMRPICVYCLHLLGAAPAGTIITVSMRRELEDGHDCVEKVIARRPEVALPYN
jgi:hypothetical protein